VAGYLAFVLLGWKVVLLPSLIRSIEHTFHQTDAGFSFLYFVSALVYGASAFGGGFLTERVGRRAVLIAAMFLAAVGTGCQAIAPSWLWFLLATLPAGLGSGFIDGGINALFLDLYRDARGGALNFLHLFFGVGALIGPFCVGLLVTAGVTWQVLMAVTALAFLVVVPMLARVSMPSGRHDVADVPITIDRAERSLVPFVGLALGIAFYVAVEIGVSSWLVQFLAAASLTVATGVLSAFWGGLSLGRLLSGWLVERLDYYAFTVGSIILASLMLAGAVLSPWLAISATLFALTGMFLGPIFPMIMALGGNVYPHRLAALSGSLTTAAVVGGIIYPPLMGWMEARIGLSGGMIGAALLGIPMAAAILVARATAPVSSRARPPGPPGESARHVS
jgi:fucose permease